MRGKKNIVHAFIHILDLMYITLHSLLSPFVPFVFFVVYSRLVDELTLSRSRTCSCGHARKHRPQLTQAARSGT